MSSRSLRRPLSLLAAAAILAAGMLTGPVVSPASAEGSKDDKIAERAEVDQQLEDLRIELNDVNDDLADTYLALAETELLIPQAQQDLEDARVALGEAQEEDRKVGERLTEAEEEERRLSGEVETGQEEVDRSDDELATVALSAYKGGGMPSPSSVYVGNSSPQDAVDRSMNYRLTMASQGTRLDSLRTDQSVTENSAERLSAVREEIKQLKIDAEDALERTRVAEEEATEAKNELDALYETQKTQRDDLEAKKTKYEGDQKSLETRSSTLDDEIEELAEQEREREERLKAQQQQKSSGGSAPVAGSANTGGGWVYPVNARLNSNFGWRVHPIYGTKKLHAGVDFPVACGVPVGAAHSGRVIARTYNSGAGNKLIVSHGIMNGRLVTTSYHHLQGFAKPVGAQVSAGETVGYVGTTGSSTGCHLHFETHEDGNAVNPAKYL
ncbi:MULTISPECIES: M23 family metallopeptidase [Brachybacterium]|uniref:Peptidoglycan DD-metalloendopeptidase family protein n=1 Tax=Brachybacterium paraconglomeratum TaxID=173362 RepID=A0A921KR60_9MICO|nr:M23 family metallopeptidase [Brachybacterium sp. AG952]TDP75529.1 murein DD-endopeptidase MepM/ murein hydrolase activator NlpD [Brachybacterium sp. AG952]HJF50350.1 peptidoglycan DD-metalloendopeptidase family protein [Brachybacterium paraconglomeratum]